MNVYGHPIPDSMALAMSSGCLRRERGSWPLREALDAFGNQLETELGEFLESETAIEHATNALSRQFKADGCYGEPSEEAAEPGAIPDIVDFSGILCFARAGDGSPFCLDYRTTPGPRIIWWDDAYWRIIAPDFDSFLRLFDI